MISALVALFIAQADPFADVAGQYAIAVEDTWGEGIDHTTTRGEVTYLPNVEFDNADHCDILEFRMGREDDERLILRFRLMRCGTKLRHQRVFDDRVTPAPLQPNGATLMSGSMEELSAKLYGGDTEVKLGFDPKSFTFVQRSDACFLRYPHGCIGELPWKTTRERIRATKR